PHRLQSSVSFGLLSVRGAKQFAWRFLNLLRISALVVTKTSRWGQSQGFSYFGDILFGGGGRRARTRGCSRCNVFSVEAFVQDMEAYLARQRQSVRYEAELCDLQQPRVG
ncbi:unnamed protein product, partial [Ectocarpus sp. 12 AP-2014]